MMRTEEGVGVDGGKVAETGAVAPAPVDDGTIEDIVIPDDLPAEAPADKPAGKKEEKKAESKEEMPF